MAKNWEKDPDSVLDWIFDWSNWLTANEEISSSSITVSAGLTLNSSSNSVATATAWISGGSPGRPYLVTNHIVTNQGRTDERSITIRVTNR